MGVVENLLEQVPLPRVFSIRQTFERPGEPDPEAATTNGILANVDRQAITAGMSVAITVGSRGISDLPAVIRGVVRALHELGTRPFIVPAMGSHGGATADGQQDVLAALGVTAEAVGAPVVSSMETDIVGTTASGLPVHVDRSAHRADAIILVNRIKPHVAFRGNVESGLQKMIAIGLGKQHGAEVCHRLGFGRMEENVRAMADVALQCLPILAAVAILENAYHETALVEVIPPEEIVSREPQLLIRARELSACLHLRRLDVLVMDVIGKDIAGSGFDTNVVGRYHTAFIPAGSEDPQITRMVALDLTPASHGNANGLGILDFITRRLYERIDRDQMYPNSLTSTMPVPVKIPMTLGSDRLAIQAAIRTCQIPDSRHVRLARIRSTRDLEILEVSENLLAEAREHPRVDVLGGPAELPFDASGNLLV